MIHLYKWRRIALTKENSQTVSFFLISTIFSLKINGLAPHSKSHFLAARQLKPFFNSDEITFTAAGFTIRKQAADNHRISCRDRWWPNRQLDRRASHLAIRAIRTATGSNPLSIRGYRIRKIKQ